MDGRVTQLSTLSAHASGLFEGEDAVDSQILSDPASQK
jgi:hypothetical protein